MFLRTLAIVLITTGMVLCISERYHVNKREIQSDGGYPKFPPGEDDDEQSRFVRKRFNTKEIPVDKRIVRSSDHSDLNKAESGGDQAAEYIEKVKKFMDMMQKVNAAYQEMQGSEGESTSKDDVDLQSKADTSSSNFDVSQMSEEMQTVYAHAMQMYAEFQKHQASLEQSSITGEQTSSANQDQNASSTNTV